MRICGLGLESPLEVRAGIPTVLEIHNPRLFSRCCQSLISGDGEGALEPYSLWDDNGKEIGADSGFLPILSPLQLPWDNKLVVGRLHRLVRDRLYEDYEVRDSIDEFVREMGFLIDRFNLQVEGEYGFGVEWDLMRYLKMLAFSPYRNAEETILDNLIRFLDVCYDMHINRALLFVNVKSFLAEIDLIDLYERMFFLNLEVLMVESSADGRLFDREFKRCIDLHFLES